MIIIMLLNFIGLIRLIQNYKIENPIKNIIYTYLTFSFAILGISSFNPFGLYEVKATTYLMWLLNINIVTLCYCAHIKKRKTPKKLKIQLNNLEKSKVLLGVQIAIMVFLAYYSYRFQALANSLEYVTDIRMLKFTILFNSFIEKLFFDYVIVSGYSIMTIISSIFLVNGKIKNPIFIIGMINVILYMTIGYGRMSIFQLAIYIVLALFLSHDFKNIQIDKQKILKVALIAVLILLVGIVPTCVRLGINIFDFEKVYDKVLSEQLKQIIVYFTGGFRSLDIFLENGFQDVNHCTLGRATFGGLEELIANMLLLIGIDLPTVNELIGWHTQEEIIIGENIKFNAFYTCIMNFYLDFGILGIAIGPVLNAILLLYVTKNLRRKKDLMSEVLFIYTVMHTMSSIYRWNYQFSSNVCTTIVLIVLINKEYFLQKGKEIINTKYRLKKGKRYL